MAHAIKYGQIPPSSCLTTTRSAMLIFEDRTDAARQLARILKDREFEYPLVLGIPRGGMVIASVLSEAIDADCDIVLARKLRAPDAPELAIGAVSEAGEVYFDDSTSAMPGVSDAYVHAECQAEIREVTRYSKLFRSVRPRAPIAGRSVIITDDGIATGATMIAALHAVRMHHPAKLIVAVPVASHDGLHSVRNWCDAAYCLTTPRSFNAVGQFYRDFEQVTEEEVVEVLKRAARRSVALED